MCCVCVMFVCSSVLVCVGGVVGVNMVCVVCVCEYVVTSLLLVYLC